MPFLTNEETEDQGGQAACPRPHCEKVAGAESRTLPGSPVLPVPLGPRHPRRYGLGLVRAVEVGGCPKHQVSAFWALSLQLSSPQALCPAPQESVRPRALRPKLVY